MVVEPSDASVSVFSSTVNEVDDTIDFTVNVLLLFVVPVTVTRSRTANFPSPVSVVEVELIVYTPPDEVKLISVPVTSET